MFNECLKKQEDLMQYFDSLPSKEACYQKIIAFGMKLPKIAPEFETQDNLVTGCQSRMYLHSRCINGKIFFQASSDALISAGLAFLLISIYSGQVPETVLKCPPLFLEKINTFATLSPSRSNGLSSLYLKMKQLALDSLIKN